MSEKKRRTEEWIQITDPDGKKMIASPSYIRKLLDITTDKRNLTYRLNELERKIERLGAPGRQEEILKLLRESGAHNRFWIRNRVPNYQRYDLRELLQNGLIVESKSGTVTMYSCAEET